MIPSTFPIWRNSFNPSIKAAQNKSDSPRAKQTRYIALVCSTLSPASLTCKMSNAPSLCSDWIPFEHMPFQVKLINLFITAAASGAIIITRLLRKE